MNKYIVSDKVTGLGLIKLWVCSRLGVQGLGGSKNGDLFTVEGFACGVHQAEDLLTAQGYLAHKKLPPPPPGPP